MQLANTPLHVFIHTAVSEDRDRLAQCLCECGFAPRIAPPGENPLHSLLDSTLDLILAELPGPDEPQPGAWIAEALVLQKQSGLHIPLIVIADPACEAQAAAFLDAGAADYLCKDRLQRLPAAVNRALYPPADACRLKEQARYQLLFEHARDIYLFVRLSDGRILEANRAAEQGYGYTRAELLGLNIAALHTPGKHALLPEQTPPIDGAAGSPNATVFETWHRRKDGSLFPVEVTSLAVDMDGARVSLNTIHDISRRKVAERAMERRMSELEALHDVAQAGTEAGSLDELVERVVKIVRQCLFPDEFGVAFLDENKGLLTYHPTAFTHLPYHEFSLPVEAGISGSVARSGKPRRESDIRLCDDFYPSGLPVLSELCVPLIVSNQVVGVLNAESIIPDFFSASDESLLVAVAGELATAMEKIRLLDAERDRRQELESLAQISAVVRAAETRAGMLPAILTEMQKVLDADGATIAMLDTQNCALVFEAGVGCWQTNHGLRIPLGHSVGSQVVATRKMLYLDQESGPDPHAFSTTVVFPTRCVLCLPLIAHEAVIGLLYLGRNLPFGPSDISLASATADIIASAFDRVHLFEKTRQQLERLTALRAIDQSILASPDLELTLAILIENITGLLKVDAVDILLYDPRHQVLLVAAEQGMPPQPILPKKVAFEDTHAGQVALHRKMEFIPDLSQVDDSMTRRLATVGARFTSYLALPLIAKDTVKGVVEIFQHQRLEPAAEWMDFLQALTDQAAIAIDNALLFKEQRQTNERLQEAYEDTIDGWSRVLDMRDKETEGHSRRVTELTMRLARRLGIAEEQLAHIRRGAQLHDIGKMGIPDNILLKPGPLTPEEWDIMREHPQYALDFLYPIGFLAPALEIPYCHHEKWDGSGYPQGLRGDKIPLAARIFAIVDVWDALTSTRPYRPAWPAGQALALIREGAGSHFDPQIVAHFLAVLSEEDRPEDPPLDG